MERCLTSVFLPVPCIIFFVGLFVLVQLLSRVRLFVTPWTAACQVSMSFTISQNLLKLVSIESVMPSSHLILCRPLLLPPSIFPSIRVFSNESALHLRWSECCSFSFSISPSNEHPGLISFRMDWLDLLAVQGTLKSLLQHHSSKPSILRLYGPKLTTIHDYSWATGGIKSNLIRKTAWCHLDIILTGIIPFPSKYLLQFRIMYTSVLASHLSLLLEYGLRGIEDSAYFCCSVYLLGPLLLITG